MKALFCITLAEYATLAKTNVFHIYVSFSAVPAQNPLLIALRNIFLPDQEAFPSIYLCVYARAHDVWNNMQTSKLPQQQKGSILKYVSC
jgi:hypothetical protein